jgi:FkbM family methyltransferase
MFVVYFLANRGGFKLDRLFTMVGSYGRLVVSDHSEMLVMREVLVDATYDDGHLPEEVDLVLDIGCNIGAAALWFADRYPGATILGVEADPRVAAIARHNLRGRTNVRVVQAAISDRSGYASFYPAADSWLSSSLGSGDGIVVPTVLIDDLVDEAGPRRVMKIDVEGAEHASFRSSNRLTEFEVITGEYHPVEGGSWESLLNCLSGFAVIGGRAASDGRRTFVARKTA